jgi:hypothetical protein
VQTAKIGVSVARCLHAVTNRIDRVGWLDRPALALVVLDDQYEEIEAVGAIAALAVTEDAFPESGCPTAEARQTVQSAPWILRCRPTAISIMAGSAAILVY